MLFGTLTLAISYDSTICVDAWLQPQHLHCISAMLFPCPRDVALYFSVLLHFRLRLIHRHGEVLIKYRQFYILLQDLSLIILCVLTTPTLAASTPTPPTRGNSTNITTPIINPTNTTFFDVVPVSLSHTLPRWTSIGWRRYFFLHQRLYYLLGMETPTARGCRLISLWLCRIQDNHNSFWPIMDIFPVS